MHLIFSRSHPPFMLCSQSVLPSAFQYSSAPASDPPQFFSSFGKRPPSVINVWCVAVYVSNRNSSVKSTLPGSDRHAWAHSALQCLLLYKADFKYSHFRGDAPQWHEASRLNRSAALSLSLCLTLSEPPLAFPLFYCDKTQQVMA